MASRRRGSLGDGQVNRLASLYDGSGKSSREAKPILARLERTSDRPLLMTLIEQMTYGGGADLAVRSGPGYGARKASQGRQGR